jgi:hypothetical protein
MIRKMRERKRNLMQAKKENQRKGGLTLIVRVENQHWKKKTERAPCMEIHWMTKGRTRTTGNLVQLEKKKKMEGEKKQQKKKLKKKEKKQ